jgi:predicted nuclease with TOPRIM domain
MRSKKTVCFFSVLLLFSALMYMGDALSIVTGSFRGGGVMIELTYPEEAHPNATITHNITITATTELTSINIWVFIYAPVNSTLQLIKSQPFSWGTLHENESLPTSAIPILLSEQVNGTLYCNMTVETDQTADTLSYKFYTSHVNKLTFSEMQTLYYEMLANYTSLQQDYETLSSDYNVLMADYTSLFENYTTLLSEYDQLVSDHGALLNDYNDLSANYSSLYITYTELESQHNLLTSNYTSKVSEYDALDDNYRVTVNELGNLNTIYSDLNTTYYTLQTDYSNLQIARSTLNQTLNNLQTLFDQLEAQFKDSEDTVNTDRVVMFIFVVTVAALIAFIVYIKRKKEDPYLVIRKETVSMKSDEKS